MVSWPNVVEAARNELGRVCGSRLPNLDEAPNLPYIRAYVKERLH